MRIPLKRTLSQVAAVMLIVTFAWLSNHKTDPKPQVLTTCISLRPGLKFMFLDLEQSPHFLIVTRLMNCDDTAEVYTFQIHDNYNYVHPILIKESLKTEE